MAWTLNKRNESFFTKPANFTTFFFPKAHIFKRHHTFFQKQWQRYPKWTRSVADLARRRKRRFTKVRQDTFKHKTKNPSLFKLAQPLKYSCYFKIFLEIQFRFRPFSSMFKSEKKIPFIIFKSDTHIGSYLMKLYRITYTRRFILNWIFKWSPLYYSSNMYLLKLLETFPMPVFVKRLYKSF